MSRPPVPPGGVVQITAHNVPLRRIIPYFHWDKARKRPSYEAFRPREKDAGHLSVFRGDKGDAAADDVALQRQRTGFTGQRSVWTFFSGVPLARGRDVVDDSGLPGKMRNHCFVDFRGLSEDEVDILAAELLYAACEEHRV